MTALKVTALKAEVDRLAIDNRRLLRECENLMGTKELAAQNIQQVAPFALHSARWKLGTAHAKIIRSIVLPMIASVTFYCGVHVPTVVFAPAAAQAEAEGRGVPTTPRGGVSRGGGGGGGGVDSAVLGRLEGEVGKLHGVIAEMAEREERLLRMLQVGLLLVVRRAVVARRTERVSRCCSCRTPSQTRCRSSAATLCAGTGRWCTTPPRSTRCCARYAANCRTWAEPVIVRNGKHRV